MKKKGFALISLALMIAGAYFLMQLAQRTERYKKEVMYAAEKESSIPMPDSQDTMPPTVQPTAIPTAMPTPTVLQQEFFSNIKIKNREDILQNLKLHGASKEVVKEELLIYANESGESGADTVSDMAEMTVDYAKETITIPCYFATGNNHIVKFDMIFNYTKKTFDFIPW